MQPDFPPVVGPLTDADLDALRRAKQQLETPPLGMKLAALIGAPIEKLLGRLPGVASDKVSDATQTALRKCLQIALKTLGKNAGDAARADGGAPEKPGNLLHKFAVATTGAAGGAFGLLALPVELPVTTTLMFRSICDIARSEGENLASPDAQLQCLTVFAMGGRSAADDEAEYGYFVVRGALAQAVSKASSELATKGFAAHGSTALLRLMQNVAARFSVQVSEQVAAKSIPAIGAVLGAMVNTVFIHHFQQVAHGHFTVRRLERRYGEAAVKAAYQAIDVSLD
ncbi:EcsC family protein [Paraburkholderia caballeronis]|uniref:EcsC protein family protein n=1 Tax=Paraburkholderia caballeronis TaxID=416943 RepID=A0A1H7I039_9BURK|nr:EcsC family protein [Paraburkholderia caballeronis]PXW29286.1 EcsC family protein [Paraburkholderia caballeronis]PXX04545.1 EcsC family protein [Paraburkholderia caballeronis]RAK05606.1 EcsC family protein [Paraburkholderia caballeronis]TDV18385.1 EcsC family protein [Paraburkholderia caballeronis]TDV20077.1 EcsC family protein [Paraburkholderia caballeronis]